MTRGRGRRAAGGVVMAFAVAVGGCTAQDTAGSSSTASEVAAEGTPSDDSASPTTPSPSPDAPVEAFVPGLSDAVVVQTTPVSGGGARPVLEWEPVDGTDDYVVMVHAADDAPYWSWSTSDTQVRVGLTDRPDTAPGPRVAEGMTWVVVARDADGLPIATSPRRPIAP